MRTSGSCESALPISSICFCAPCPAGGPATRRSSAKPELVQHRPARLAPRLCDLTKPDIRDERSRPRNMIVNDVEVGGERQLLKDHGDTKRASRCRIFDCDSGLPSRQIVPRSARCTPAMIFANVDLPEPFSPSSARTPAGVEARGSHPAAPGSNRKTFVETVCRKADAARLAMHGNQRTRQLITEAAAVSSLPAANRICLGRTARCSRQ